MKDSLLILITIHTRQPFELATVKSGKRWLILTLIILLAVQGVGRADLSVVVIFEPDCREMILILSLVVYLERSVLINLQGLNIEPSFIYLLSIWEFLLWSLIVLISITVLLLSNELLKILIESSRHLELTWLIVHNSEAVSLMMQIKCWVILRMPFH